MFFGEAIKMLGMPSPKTVRVHYKIEIYEDIELGEDYTLDEAISVAGEILAQGYEFNAEDLKFDFVEVI